MSIAPDDVRHIAALARLALDEGRLPSLVEELNVILAHMKVLQGVDTEGVIGAAGVGASGTPLRADVGAPIQLSMPLDQIAPRMRDGFFLVPRLDTHGELGASVAGEP
ncbi:MAG TPA: Asp-tRNA(Asn)/Glu-tRNA(Gln) amidotransferase subunit GatC [Gemmatimonadaceae bacterium]|nr:Asp-tRNA(Asn)/Glu-tRNA(Gln) amidotransferase subunit GatC [Gemmatimonadaceae bacterium]